MEKGKMIGIWAGITGTVLGCTAWIFLLGISLGDLWLVLVTAGAVVLCFAAGSWILRFRPERYIGAAGLITLWLMLLNGVVINAYYEKIPASVWGVSTGKTAGALFQANFLIAVLALAASGCVLYEIFRKNGRQGS